METPFPYARFVTGKHFIGRRNDVTLLGNLLSQGEHVVLSAPPKAGKTSLVQQTLLTMRMNGRPFTVGQFSALNIRTVGEFLLRLGSTLISMVAFTPEEYAAIVRKYLSDTHFVFDPSAFAEKGQLLSLNWDWDAGDVQAILRLPFALSADRSERLFLIIDEFQCLSLLDDPDALFRPLDASLRADHPERRFSYIFCGSGVNAMKAIFENSFLFHRQVNKVNLSAVDELEMADHIHRGFLSSGKVVDKDLLLGACRLFKGNIWYINHFAAICDSMTRGYIMEPMLVDSLNTLVSIHEPRFLAIMNDLTNFQVQLLRATIDGVTRFSAADVIRRYGLHSSANVKRVKDALMKKEVLTFDANDTPVILDALFEYWVKKYYFEKKD